MTRKSDTTDMIQYSVLRRNQTYVRKVMLMLKWLAVLFMLIDHLGYYLYPIIPNDLYILMRAIGRLAFPIFAYSIVKGADRTKNLGRYFLRLISFAVIGQLIMEWAARSVNQETFTNVLFTLAFGLMLIAGVEFITQSMQDVVMQLRPLPAVSPSSKTRVNFFNLRVSLRQYSLPAWQGILIGASLVLVSITMVILLEPDYELFGLAVILLFYILDSRLEPEQPNQTQAFKQKRVRSFFITFALLNLVNAILKILENPSSSTWAIISMISTFSVFLFPLDSRSERRPAKWEKYFFYIFYPLHIAILILISARIA